MYTWLSRFMTAVFLLNVLSPAYAQVPLPRRRVVDQPIEEARRQADMAREVLNGVEKSRLEYLESVAPNRDFAHDEFLIPPRLRKWPPLTTNWMNFAATVQKR